MSDNDAISMQDKTREQSGKRKEQAMESLLGEYLILMIFLSNASRGRIRDSII